LQTMFVPHVVPPGLVVSSSAQVWVPVAHDVTPFLQEFGLPVQTCPAAQATQAPALLHTVPMPQLEPAARFAPSLQVVAIPVHVVIPCLQAVGLPVQV
jgi:hypothetical protein